MVLQLKAKLAERSAKENNMAAKGRMVDIKRKNYETTVGSSENDMKPLPTDVKNKMGYIKKGDMSAETRALPDEVVKPPKGIGKSEDDMEPRKYKKGGMVKSSASKRADGCAVRGKTRA
jgi:hypothetical protein